VRADRLLSLVLLLQARGHATAEAIATELEVSVRTVYRDLEALIAAGVPVLTESGPGGGCRLMEGYRFPLRGLRPDEAEALLILGVPGVLRELGLDRALDAAQRQIRVTAGAPDDAALNWPGPSAAAPNLPGPSAAALNLPGVALVHLDMPRWFGGQEEVPCLRDLAQALRSRRRLAIRYAEDAGPRVISPLGLVNKAGLWYLVACPPGSVHHRVFRVARLASARVLAEPAERPAGFELAAFWRQWSAEFEASRPRLPVTLRASPAARAAFGEIFGQAVLTSGAPTPAATLPSDQDGRRGVAPPPDRDGWQVVTLTFEHERAAVHRLAGFGDQVEVLTPPSVRAGLVAAARQILERYHAADG
jgi:predicted DNA-binding transcriptional regulator YafY